MNNTKNKLIDTAIEMFNKKGASNVSTVQLAANLKISPGNLYYYFDNKEHLIRELYLDRITPDSLCVYTDDDVKMSENGVLKMLTGIAEYTYKYRFFFLEENTLLKNDSSLIDLHIKRLEEVLKHLCDIVDSWIEVGIMVDMKPGPKEMLIQNMVAISRTWLTFTDITTRKVPGKMDMKSAVLHLYFLILPYFTEVAKNRILRLFELNNFDTTSILE